MKIGCHCGAVIVDQSDNLPHKGHLIPDQEWFATYDAIDDEIIDPVADGRLSKEAAYHRARRIIGRSARLVWQCRACGRLYIDGPDGQLRRFVPEGEPTDREILRSTPSRAGSWAVWRIDDNGNTFLVRGGLGRDEADRVAAEFTARGHKQTYWVEREAAEPPAAPDTRRDER